MAQSDAILALIAELYASAALKDEQIKNLFSQMENNQPEGETEEA